jgi:hypothetical protein
MKLFALTHHVNEIKPTGEPRRVNFERIATALWKTEGEDKKAVAVKRSE